MSDKLDDLERLARLRDEGKISEAQYEQLKQDLVPQAESMSHALPPPGWYPDTNGVANRKAYWDGQQWTGHIHDEVQSVATAPNLTAKPKRSGCLWGVIVVIVLIVLTGVVALVAVQLAGQEVSATFSEVASGLDATDTPPATVASATGDWPSESAYQIDVTDTANKMAELMDTFVETTDAVLDGSLTIDQFYVLAGVAADTAQTHYDYFVTKTPPSGYELSHSYMVSALGYAVDGFESAAGGTIEGIEAAAPMIAKVGTEIDKATAALPNS